MQKFPLDPHRDPHGETHGRKQWNKQAATSSFLDKKPPQSLIQQGLEGSTAVGKDEVGSSNLPSSSKKHRKLRFSMLFCCKNAGNGVGQNVGQLPDPHRDPHRLAISGFAAYCQLPHEYNEMRRKIQRAPERKPLPFRCSVCLWDLLNLCHETAHFLCGLLLHLPRSVCVGA